MVEGVRWQQLVCLVSVFLNDSLLQIINRKLAQRMENLLVILMLENFGAYLAVMLPFHGNHLIQSRMKRLQLQNFLGGALLQSLSSLSCFPFQMHFSIL